MISKLEDIKDAINDDKSDIDLKPIEEKLDALVEGQKRSDCINQGYDGYSKDLKKCTGDLDSTIDPSYENISQLPDVVSASGIGQSLTKLSTAGSAVSSTCSGVMVQDIKLKLGNFVDETYSLNLCQWIEPIQDFLRLISLMFWGLVSFRIIFEA